MGGNAAEVVGATSSAGFIVLYRRWN